jgi:acetyl-CoA carboxylase carboxyl transferase subunit alpha
MVPAPLPFEDDIHELELQLSKLESAPDEPGAAEAIKKLRREITTRKKERYEHLKPWETVLVARHKDRPQTMDYVETMFDEFVELHGDRAFGDDRAIRTGFARLDGQKVMLIGHQKGKTLAERTQCYYGCTHPEGYRKALIKMKLAAKYQLPIIATSILEMSRLPSPIICVVIGEGGSGGALGIGIGDRVGMLQHAYYSVISPEGCAGILWKVATDETKLKAAGSLRLTARDLHRFGVIDHIVPEPLGGAHRAPREMMNSLKSSLNRHLRELKQLSLSDLLDQRYKKFRSMGQMG